MPPPPPKVCFGRDELIERIIDLTDNRTPTALIGAGGIGKTSIALAVLHHDRIKERFGDHRRFIRCDQFPASHAHFLRRLSKVIGAGVENPKDLTILRPSLSSKEMFIVLDNAESILDPRGADAHEIFATVEELSQFSNVHLCITSRITTIPPDCKCLDVPTLSMDAAHSAFYRIYDNDDRPDDIKNVLEQLDFHPLSVTLLATVAHQNKWDNNRLTREWEGRRTGVLQTEHNRSLAATIELSLSSPLFQQLGPDARGFLGVVAFFPQGIDENNLGWLFPSISNGSSLFDKFCILSLTYRSNGFVTMLAPLRDYLCPKDPKSSPLLCATTECYFARLSVGVGPNNPDFKEARWIRSEDVNVEHLLDVFTTVDANSDSVWDACINFMKHLFWHKRRPIILRLKIEGLPDDHRLKPGCLSELSKIVVPVESTPLLAHALKLERERGNDHGVAQMLMQLAWGNRSMGLIKEGIQLAKEALEIFERVGDTPEQAEALGDLGWLLRSDGQLDDAEEAVTRAINMLPETGCQALVCDFNQLLGNIYRVKGELEKAISHYKVVIATASLIDFQSSLFWGNYALARVYLAKGEVDDARAHIEQAKPHAVSVNYTPNVGRAMYLHAVILYTQDRKFEEARSEVLRAVDIFEKTEGMEEMVEMCRGLVQRIDRIKTDPVASYSEGEFLEIDRKSVV